MAVDIVHRVDRVLPKYGFTLDPLAPKLAWLWAKRQFPGMEVGVVHARIRLGVCLNILTREFDEMYNEAEKILDKGRRGRGEAPLANRGKNHARDRDIDNRLFEAMDQPIDCVSRLPTQARVNSGSVALAANSSVKAVAPPVAMSRLRFPPQ